MMSFRIFPKQTIWRNFLIFANFGVSFTFPQQANNSKILLYTLRIQNLP